MDRYKIWYTFCFFQAVVSILHLLSFGDNLRPFIFIDISEWIPTMNNYEDQKLKKKNPQSPKVF